VAHLRPFLNGTILFSLISPEYERYLKEELFGCFKHIKIPFDELMKMPTRDRKFYILKHNEAAEEERREYEEKKNGGTAKTEAIDAFTDIDQQNLKNSAKR
jgi:hypothetical protein